MKDKLLKIVEITPAYDRRNINPDENYGIHGCNLKLILKGDKGAVHFIIYTNWHLPHVQNELLSKVNSSEKHLIEATFLPMPADVGYHSPIPRYEGQSIISDSCEYLDGKPCYYDGSGLRAYEWFEILVEQGLDAIWKLLKDEYTRLFLEV